MNHMTSFRAARLFPAVMLVGMIAAGSAGAQSVQVWETDGDQSKLLLRRPNLSLTAVNNSGSFTIGVNDQLTYQQIDGFGASLTDSAATVIAAAFPAGPARTAFMKSLFDPNTGIGISFLRQPMGATDFSASGNYSYDDTAGNAPDPQLAQFSIAHDLTNIVPLLQQALTINPNAKVMMLPWSPPAWMKTDLSMNAGGFNTAYYASLAQYFVKSIQAYQALGIPIYAIAAQNEPLNPSNATAGVGYPTMYFPEDQEAAFIGGYLGPALTAASLSGVRILGYEHNWDNTSYPESLLADTTAGPYVAGSSFHCYAGNVSAEETVWSAFPAKNIWFTECTGTTGTVFATDLAWNAENLLIDSTRNWGKSVVLWNLALNPNSAPQNGGCTNCRGVVTVNANQTPPLVTKNVEYYVLGHLAKFVQPGAVRVDSNTFGSGSVEDVAFKNPDGSLVLFVLNAASGSSTFVVNWSTKSFTDTLPAGAVATYLWSGMAPTFPSDGVVNAAAVAQPLSPGGIFSIYGTQLAGAVFGATSIPLTTSFGSTSVAVNNVPAPLFYAGPSQINAQMPWNISPGMATVSLTTGGQTVNQFVTVAAAGPGIFTFDGTRGIALNPDYSLNSSTNPAPSGGYVTLFGTGPGPVTPADTTGQAAPGSPLEYASSSSATWASGPLAVYFAGMAPGFVGTMQVNVAVPTVSAATAVDITVTVNGVAANPAQVFVAP
jgi:glucosylceramidase